MTFPGALRRFALHLMQYGKQFVPVQPEDEAYLAYRPDKGISLMGFLDADKVAQHYHIKVDYGRA